MVGVCRHVLAACLSLQGLKMIKNVSKFGRKQGLKHHPQLSPSQEPVRQHPKDLMPILIKIQPHCRLCMSSREASHTTKASKPQAARCKANTSTSRAFPTCPYKVSATDRAFSSGTRSKKQWHIGKQVICAHYPPRHRYEIS